MKKLFLLPILCILLVACSGSDDSTTTNPPNPDLFMRTDANTTLIPLINEHSWTFHKVTGTEEKPDKEIKNILNNDAITAVKILPVRKFDDNDGSGMYEYQALCYVTNNNIAYFYMNEKILVGRYLYSDKYGNESVIWDFEFPTHVTEKSSRYFTLNRKVNIDDIGVNIDENFLHEMPNYYTIDVEVNLPNVKRYTNCKLFQYNSHRVSASDPIRVNKFYFKEGVGLVRYQQFAIIDTNEARLFEQNIIED